MAIVLPLNKGMIIRPRALPSSRTCDLPSFPDRIIGKPSSRIISLRQPSRVSLESTVEEFSIEGELPFCTGKVMKAKVIVPLMTNRGFLSHDNSLGSDHDAILLRVISIIVNFNNSSPEIGLQLRECLDGSRMTSMGNNRSVLSPLQSKILNSYRRNQES